MNQSVKLAASERDPARVGPPTASGRWGRQIFSAHAETAARSHLWSRLGVAAVSERTIRKEAPGAVSLCSLLRALAVLQRCLERGLFSSPCLTFCRGVCRWPDSSLSKVSAPAPAPAAAGGKAQDGVPVGDPNPNERPLGEWPAAAARPPGSSGPARSAHPNAAYLLGPTPWGGPRLTFGPGCERGWAGGIDGIPAEPETSPTPALPPLPGLRTASGQLARRRGSSLAGRFPEPSSERCRFPRPSAAPAEGSRRPGGSARSAPAAVARRAAGSSAPTASRRPGQVCAASVASQHRLRAGLGESCLLLGSGAFVSAAASLSVCSYLSPFLRSALEVAALRLKEPLPGLLFSFKGESNVGGKKKRSDFPTIERRERIDVPASNT